MTTNDLRELDAALARVLGWTERNVPFLLDEDGATLTIERFWLDPSGVYAPLPPFTRTMRAARLLEDEIERRGRFEEYAHALFKIVNDGIPWGHDVAFSEVLHLLRATPEQRARAALATLSNSDIVAPHQP